MVLYGWVIFLGAFLLFQIQPLIAKIILPSFGGSSVVWSTCMLFFQVVLLLGYAYAHWLNEHLRATRQAMVHSALLLVSIAVLPIGPDAARSVTGVEHPSWQILKLLAVAIGIPYFLLSSTSPLSLHSAGISSGDRSEGQSKRTGLSFLPTTRGCGSL